VHGVGRLLSANGDAYQGTFRANKFHGVGRFRKGNGDTFLGQCRDGRAEGYGARTRPLAVRDAFSSPLCLRRVFFVAARHVRRWGVLALASGEVYKGMFKRDKRCGKGVAIYPNGCR
jgi:hypothetical protein